MIGWAILGIMALLAGIAMHARRAYVRDRRQRELLRHVGGGEEWWGQR